MAKSLDFEQEVKWVELARPKEPLKLLQLHQFSPNITILFIMLYGPLHCDKVNQENLARSRNEGKADLREEPGRGSGPLEMSSCRERGFSTRIVPCNKYHLVFLYFCT